MKQIEEFEVWSPRISGIAMAFSGVLIKTNKSNEKATNTKGIVNSQLNSF